MNESTGSDAWPMVAAGLLVVLVIAAITSAILFNSLNKRQVEQQKFNVCTKAGGVYVRASDERSVCIR